MPTNPIDLTVAGHTYRLSADLPHDQLRHLAHLVDLRLETLAVPTRLTPQQRLLYVALALAADLEDERTLHRETRQRARNALQGVLRRIDDALDSAESTPPPPALLAQPLPDHEIPPPSSAPPPPR